MSKFSKVLVFLTLTFFISIASYSQSKHVESRIRYCTVEQVDRSAINFEKLNIPVMVRGYLIQQMSRIMFKFEDETGIIQLNIPPDVYPKNFYNTNIEIIVMGYVNFSDFDKTVINVKKVIVPSL